MILNHDIEEDPCFIVQRPNRQLPRHIDRALKGIQLTGEQAALLAALQAAQRATLERIDFFIQKAKFYDRLNERQEKEVARIFKEGTAGFKGGLSAGNYISITNTSRTTATRDLQQLVEIGAFTRTGERRHTRYSLSLQI